MKRTRTEMVEFIKNLVEQNNGFYMVPVEILLSNGDEDGEGEFFELLFIRQVGDELIFDMDIDEDDEWNLSDLTDQDIEDVYTMLVDVD